MSVTDDSEIGHSPVGGDTHTTLVTYRRLEDLGTSSNPIIIGVSPTDSRVTSEISRGRTHFSSRSSRRKCPLGAYVEIIDESIPTRAPTTNSNNMTTPAPMSVQPTPNEEIGDTFSDASLPSISRTTVDGTADEASTMETTEDSGPFLQVPKNFEILMRCSVCMEIFHNPATVSPCNHKFCYSCLLSWKRTNQTAVCPQCRGPIHSMQKDAQFNEVVESFLFANPSKRRPSSELETLDSMETECTEWQNGNQRGRRRGTMPQPRTRSARDRTVRTPLLVRVSQIRAHRPPQRQRGHRGVLEDWFNI